MINNKNTELLGIFKRKVLYGIAKPKAQFNTPNE